MRGALLGAAAAVARNPVAVGGSTAFFVSLAFVSANALWYQPQVHPNAFVATRAPAGPVELAPEVPDVQPTPAPRRVSTQAAPSRQAPEETVSAAAEAGDARVRSVQKVLGELGLYPGPVDGLTGPQTREAVQNYRRIVGLEPGTSIDAPLLRQLGLDEDGTAVQAAAPTPAPRPGQDRGDDVQTASVGEAPPAAPSGDPVVMRVQAGLKAFGNDGIEVDGIMGENTREAIREFQSLFGLPVTGEPDPEFMAKMQEIGLTN